MEKTDIISGENDNLFQGFQTIFHRENSTSYSMTLGHKHPEQMSNDIFIG